MNMKKIKRDLVGNRKYFNLIEGIFRFLENEYEFRIVMEESKRDDPYFASHGG